MLLDGVVGPVPLADGAARPARLEKTGAVVTQDAHARYQEAVLRGNVFFACNSASQALSTNSTTATGLILSNPPGSAKQLVLIALRVALLTAPAGISNLILTGQLTPSATDATHTTPLIVRNALVGNLQKGVGLADSAATTIATTIFMPIGGGPVATGSVTSPYIKEEFAGEIVLLPGTHISLQCLTTAISVIASISWEELPL